MVLSGYITLRQIFPSKEISHRLEAELTASGFCCLTVWNSQHTIRGNWRRQTERNAYSLYRKVVAVIVF